MELFRSTDTLKIAADKKLEEMPDHSFTITDIPRRHALLQKVDEDLHEQTDFVASHQDPGVYGVNPKLKGGGLSALQVFPPARRMPREVGPEGGGHRCA